jgi:hypothetical protein
MRNNVRWSVVVSEDTDIALRTFLARNGLKKGELSKFVEEAVCWRVLDRTVQEVKTRNKQYRINEIENTINEAVISARNTKKNLRAI